jgi:predicted nucleic acid-binding protein
MNKAPLKCVIDANVALKLFFVQPQSDIADALFAQLEASALARFYVPDFFYAECASAFVNYVRLAKYPARAAMQDMAELRALSLSVVPTTDLVMEALAIALHHRLNGYDACYVALAHQIQAPLITADEKLVKAMAGKYEVEPLANYASLPM